MIKTYEKFRIIDVNKQDTGIHLEVNWDVKDKKTNECKMVRFLIGDKEFIVSRDELNSLLFLMGTPQQQMDLLPIRKQTTRWYETVVSVEAKSDIRKGEKITFPLKITLPTVEEEVIQQIKREQGEKGRLFIPK